MEGFYIKRAKCPVCHQEVSISRLKYGSYTVTSRDSDLHNWVTGPNPIHYLPVVCGNCGYAALESKFEELSPEELKKLLPYLAKKRVTGVRALSHERTAEEALEGLTQVFEQYQLRGVDPYTLGYTAHSIAWLHREMGMSEKEKEWLEKALNFYLKAYESSMKLPEAIGESGLSYLIADLYGRLGEYRYALQWASRVVQMPADKKKPLFDQLSRELWQNLRERNKEQPPSDQPWQGKVKQLFLQLLTSRNISTSVYDSLVKNMGLWSMLESLEQIKGLSKEELQQVASFEWVEKVKELSKGKVIVGLATIEAACEPRDGEPAVYVFPDAEPKPPCLWVCDKDRVTKGRLLWQGFGFVKGSVRKVYIWEVLA
ncbi:DUF2225 domain-containing protein [Coprothermobacteraceae bacterium]|nr:DUF2225 domain-containing protein [Coprothermobacteraceae bacterium]